MSTLNLDGLRPLLPERRILLLAVALLLPACGTTRIVGRVLDEQNKPVRQAQVETDPHTDFVITNQDGLFVIDRHLQGSESQPLKPGHYKVTVKRLGCNDRVLEAEVTENSALQLGDIVIKRKETEMGAVQDVEPSRDLVPSAVHELGNPMGGI